MVKRDLEVFAEEKDKISCSWLPQLRGRGGCERVADIAFALGLLTGALLVLAYVLSAV